MLFNINKNTWKKTAIIWQKYLSFGVNLYLL